jgi:hypothetical protein
MPFFAVSVKEFMQNHGGQKKFRGRIKAQKAFPGRVMDIQFRLLYRNIHHDFSGEMPCD